MNETDFYFNGKELIEGTYEFTIHENPNFERVVIIVKAKARRAVELFGQFQVMTEHGDVWQIGGDYYLVSDRYMSTDELEKYHYMVLAGLM